ncbi:hypothetical protein XA68_17928 [Ophiocordyceps unilateralis]|uniref:DNA replication complex GINS protein SLD5 n=1 Tax=Ophiocordyceps unilateralis TaxID=268505 RepID=A0A2A9PK24_OPHUN|nr:hypothetical protein XA68_17928 [Ophiocordyceps unilateralis]
MQSSSRQTLDSDPLYSLRGPFSKAQWTSTTSYSRTVGARAARLAIGRPVELMTGVMDPKTNFALIVIQTELERYKFLVRSYLRVRIAKIDRHALYYLSKDELRARLSSTELAYATRHQALLHNHYLSSFLASFPRQLQNLNDTAGNVSMIDAPDLDTAVFIRMLRDCDVHGKGSDADNTVPAETGDVLILRWSSAKPLVESGDAELV